MTSQHTNWQQCVEKDLFQLDVMVQRSDENDSGMSYMSYTRMIMAAMHGLVPGDKWRVASNFSAPRLCLKSEK